MKLLLTGLQTLYGSHPTNVSNNAKEFFYQQGKLSNVIEIKDTRIEQK